VGAKKSIIAANNKVGVLPSLKNAAQAGMSATFLNSRPSMERSWAPQVI
jgi:hypothetical protein